MKYYTRNRNKEADKQANLAREGHGSIVQEQAYISAASRARRISEQRAAVKAQWEQERCSKFYSYRSGESGSRRTILMQS